MVYAYLSGKFGRLGIGFEFRQYDTPLFFRELGVFEGSICEDVERFIAVDALVCGEFFLFQKEDVLGFAMHTKNAIFPPQEFFNGRFFQMSSSHNFPPIENMKLDIKTDL
jgi:hypothetical protein